MVRLMTISDEAVGLCSILWWGDVSWPIDFEIWVVQLARPFAPLLGLHFDLLRILVKVTVVWNIRDFWNLSVEMLTVVFRDYMISSLVGVLLIDMHPAWVYVYLEIYRDCIAQEIFQVYNEQVIFHLTGDLPWLLD